MASLGCCLTYILLLFHHRHHNHLLLFHVVVIVDDDDKHWKEAILRRSYPKFFQLNPSHCIKYWEHTMAKGRLFWTRTHCIISTSIAISKVKIAHLHDTTILWYIFILYTMCMHTLLWNSAMYYTVESKQSSKQQTQYIVCWLIQTKSTIIQPLTHTPIFKTFFLFLLLLLLWDSMSSPEPTN